MMGWCAEVKDANRRVAEAKGWADICDHTYAGCPGGKATGKLCGVEPGDSQHRRRVLPNWAGDIAQAWELVDEIRENGLVSLILINEQWGCDMWLGRVAEPKMLASARVEATAALAIAHSYADAHWAEVE